MKRRLAVRGIFVLNDKLLAVKHKPYMGKPVDYWCVIGGTVDPGEPFLPALSREIIEETGVEPKVGRLLFVQQFINKHHPVEEIEFFFLIENPEDYANIDSSKTSHGLEEIESMEYIDPAGEEYNLKPRFLREIDTQDLPREVQFFSYKRSV